MSGTLRGERIDGEAYWDGGLVSNTPLSHILTDDENEDTLVFQVDLFSARGPLPGDLFEVEHRRKQISYSSRTRLNTDHFRKTHALRRAIVELFESLPPERRQDERLQALRELGWGHSVAIVHLIYRPRTGELHSSDYEFSRASMKDHWQAGLDDTRRSLRSPDWCAPPTQSMAFASSTSKANEQARASHKGEKSHESQSRVSDLCNAPDKPGVSERTLSLLRPGISDHHVPNGPPGP